MEEALVSGVTHNTKEVKFTLFEVPDQPGIAGTVFWFIIRDRHQCRYDCPKCVERLYN